MRRFDIINYLIRVNDYKTFLEIGTQEKINLSEIKIDYKVCVDPDPYAQAHHIMTSDDFFKLNKEKFDIIFVDGLHHSDFAYRDIINSLHILNDGGCIVVHDVIPQSFNAQVIPMDKAYEMGTVAWNGDVWKSWVKIRTQFKNMSMKVVDTDHGCGIITLIENGKGDFLESFNDGYYEYDKLRLKEHLNLITPNEFVDLYSKKISKIYNFF